MAITRFGPWRSPIPEHGDHPFRSMAITDSGPWRSPELTGDTGAMEASVAA
jgi:hypothetical protein